MTLYRVHLMAADGSLYEIRELNFDHDDNAIDYAGWLDHLEEIYVWEGERLVAHFPSEKIPHSPFNP